MAAECMFRVGGMTCGSCSASITEMVSNLLGVKSCQVSLLTEEAKIEYDPGMINTATLKTTIEDCGFDAELISNNASAESDLLTIVRISGMSCGSCSASITEALESITGIILVSISLITEIGSISHSSQVTTDDIIQKITDCGFDAEIEKSSVTSSLITSKFSISGMTCGSCSGSITEALENNAKIKNVSISLVTEEGSVDHSPDLSREKIISIIEDCGFEATYISTPDLNENDEDDLLLEIIGISPETDLMAVQYNIEAFINSSLGILKFSLHLKDIITPDVLDLPIVGVDEDHDNSNDELLITYDSSLIGVRDIVDGLNSVDPEIEFIVTNSIDQASASQLKILSKVKDVLYWRLNFMKALIFGVPVILLNHAQNLSIFKHWMIFPGFYVVSLIQLVITVYVQFVLGAIFIKKFKTYLFVKGSNATMDVLVCISTMVLFIFSVLSLGISAWNGQKVKPPKVLFDTSCMLVLFISFGKWLENEAKGSTSTALSKLLSLTPSNCTIINDNEGYNSFLKSQMSTSKRENLPDFAIRNISIDLIQTNDIAIVLPGGKIPADGVVVYGESDVDESIITGESLPVYKKEGDEVIGGSINGSELIHIKVLRSGKKSQLQQIISLVKNSQVNKAPVQRYADWLAARFVPSVLMLASVTFLLWTVLCLLLHEDRLPSVFNKDENGRFFVCLKIAISVVVVACPCALGLAAPTAVMVGTGVGASLGVLIKGGDIFEKANSVNVILFDKTGTLTTGNMRLVHHEIVSDLVSSDEWWQIIGSVENNSDHPIGKSINNAAREKLGLTFDEDVFNCSINEFKVLPGKGVKANVELPTGKLVSVYIGTERLLKENFPEEKGKFVHNSTNTLAYIVIDGQYAGYLEFTDEVKKNAREVLYYLRHVEKYQIGIVTGDSHNAAAKIGRELGISRDNIFSEVSPINKDKVIVELRERLGGVGNVGIAFVGDGINDAPALVQADIGMAISSGTDIAMDSADIVLLGKHEQPDLNGVVNALSISNVTFNRVKWNFLWAACYNVFMLPFAMGCFLPFNLMLPPIAAGGAMMLSSVSVVLNSLLLKRYKSPVLDRSMYADLEYEIATGEDFNLKSGTLQEFNQIKRSKNFKNEVRSALRKVNPLSSLSSPKINNYELVPT